MQNKSSTSTKIETPPQPETSRALLVSAGIPRPTATTHFFKEARLIEIDAGVDSPLLPGLRKSTRARTKVWGFYFACFKTGVERLWGTQRTAEDLEQDLN